MTKYLVTDPCYLLDIDSEVGRRYDLWSLCMDDMFNGHDNRYDDRTNYTGVQKILSEGLGIEILRVSDTGYGDWSNELHSNSNNVNILNPNFYADAGMMCVVKINEKLEKFLENNNIGAIFETEEEISVDINTEDDDWYVLNIKDKNGWNTLAYSDEPEDEYEDEDEVFYRENGYYPWENDPSEDDPFGYEDDENHDEDDEI